MDAEEIQITLDNALRLGRLDAVMRQDTESILRGLELIKDGKPLNAAVALYGKSNHLEITNPGALQFGITPEKLTMPHESKPWNPIIANVFYRAGIIERWGMGTLNIIDWCVENGNPSPTWDDQSGSVFVSFFPAVLFDDRQGGEDVDVKVEMTIPDKTRSSKQKYRLTDKGREVLKGKIP